HNARAKGHLACVAMDNIDLGLLAPDHLGDDLRKNRLAPLSMGMQAGKDRDAACRVHPDGGRFVKPARRGPRARRPVMRAQSRRPRLNASAAPVAAAQRITRWRSETILVLGLLGSRFAAL